MTGGTSASGSSRHRAYACAVCVAMLAAVYLPALENWRDEPEDGFPLSYYPMFSMARTAQLRVTYVVGVDQDGTLRKIPHELLSPGGMHQVRRQLSECKRDRALARDYLAAAAARIRRKAGDRHRDLERLQIVTETYDVAGYLLDGDEALRFELRAQYVLPPAESDARETDR